MPSDKDLFMFVTGVVGRAMGSGKFVADDIAVLAHRAHGAFVEVFGEVTPDASPSFASPTAQPAASGGKPVPDAEGKSWALWSGDKIGFGKKSTRLGKTQGECSWAEIRMLALEGDSDARGHLTYLVNKENDPSSKWAAANNRQKARAAAVLSSL